MALPTSKYFSGKILNVTTYNKALNMATAAIGTDFGYQAIVYRTQNFKIDALCTKSIPSTFYSKGERYHLGLAITSNPLVVGWLIHIGVVRTRGIRAGQAYDNSSWAFKSLEQFYEFWSVDDETKIKIKRQLTMAKIIR